MSIDFLTIEDVLAIHADQIQRYGGDHGVRDLGMLASAVAQPMVGFEGTFLHEDLFAMAAAYLFHIAQNHPFVDGNKRAAAVSALVFLDLNDTEVDPPDGSVYDLTMAAAQGLVDKKQIADTLRSWSV